MKNNEKDNIVDVDYSESPEINSNQRIINGEPLFYTTTQVAEMVGEEASTIRYWANRFEDLLDVEISNKNKQFKKTDVEKLIFIKKLSREDGLTLKQVRDYCKSKGFNINTIEKSVVDSSNPLAIQTLISAITIEIDSKLDNFAKELLNNIKEQNEINLMNQENINDKLQEQIAITVDEIIFEQTKEIKDSVQEIKSLIDIQEKQAKDRDTEMIDMLRSKQEAREKLNRPKKSIFSWFKRE